MLVAHPPFKLVLSSKMAQDAAKILEGVVKPLHGCVLSNMLEYLLHKYIYIIYVQLTVI